MRRVLIVSPNFPPVSTPEMQRVRMSLPFLHEFGWEAVVLTIDPACSKAILEKELLDTVPPDVEIVRTSAVPNSFTRKLGINNAGLRAFPFLYRAGARTLARQHFDLVYFSTTMFPTMALARLWRKQFSIPYVLDMQDPWVTDYYEFKPKAERPPKYWVGQRVNKFLEAWTMSRVGGLIAVSEPYHRELCERYQNIRPSLCRTIPFGAAASDQAIAERHTRDVNFLPEQAWPREDGCCHGVYVGVLGNVMKFSCRVFCEALRKGLEENPALFSRLRLHFIGTDYAPTSTGRHTILPIAKELGLEKFIYESPDRVAYFTTLRVLRQADFLLVPGTDDPTYTASKIYPYILSKKPILALFHEKSSAVSVLRETSAGEVVSFASGDDRGQVVGSFVSAWQSMLRRLPFQPSTDWSAFQTYTAEEMTRKQCELFDAVVDDEQGRLTGHRARRKSAVA
jgi:hypothetical protein